MPSENKVLWRPPFEFIQNSNLKKYKNWLRREKGLDFDGYSKLWQWSVDQLEDFWESIWEYFEIQYTGDYTQVLSGHEMPGVDWFQGTQLNYAEHIFRKRSEDRQAIIFQNEWLRRDISWDELEARVKSVQLYLRQMGIGQGDCVSAYLPNIPESIICFLAANSIGAVWSCCSPDFGHETVIERLSEIRPKLLIAADGYTYGGKVFGRMPEVEMIRKAIPSIQNTLFIPYLDSESKLENSTNWEDLNDVSRNEPLAFTRVPFEHPIWVLYSSGTTGRPKAITHSHGGVLLEHLKYMHLHNDVKPGENFFWFTTTGWMMWNFLQASMLVGATPVLYDGSPGYPSMHVLWEMAEELPIHHFGTSAPYLTACMKKELEIGREHDLSKLRSVGSTGSPLPPEVFEWTYDHIKKDLWLCSMSGGTDVCTAFVGSNPYAPVIKGRIESRALGCALFAYDSNGEHVIEELGEMVIEKPMPSMPIYFWNDEGGVRYKESYFVDYPGKWRHGDWIRIYDDGSLIIQGRSDATLNRKGVRIGTGEIYNVLDKMEQLSDALVLNLEMEGGGDVMPLFVMLDDGEVLTDELKNKIKSELRKQCSPRHVPDEIYAVSDIPYTLSGKKMEVPIKKIFMKMDVAKSLHRDAIRNPEAVDEFVRLAAELKLV